MQNILPWWSFDLPVKYALIINKLIFFIFAWYFQWLHTCLFWSWQVHSSVLLLLLLFLPLEFSLSFQTYTCAYLPSSLKVRLSILISSVANATSCEEAMLCTQLYCWRESFQATGPQYVLAFISSCFSSWRQRMAKWIPVLGYLLVSQVKFADLGIYR